MSDIAKPNFHAGRIIVAALNEKITTLTARAEKAEADLTYMQEANAALREALAEARKVIAEVERWWVETGMHEPGRVGAPACIFAVRDFLEKYS